MDFIQDSKPDLSTKESATKTIFDIAARQKVLAESNRDLKEQMQQKVADLTSANKRLGELEARSRMTTTAISAENEVARYVDGNKVRWTAETRSDGVTLPGLLDDSNTVCDWQREMKRLMEQRTFVKMLTKRGHSPQTNAQIDFHMKAAPDSIKRIFADSAGIGAEWVPDILSTDLATDFYAARRVEALFQSVNMTSKELRLPFITLATTPYLKSVPTSDDPSNYTATTDTTAQRSISCDSFATRIQIDEDAVEDAVIPLIGTVRASLVASMVDGIEDAIINGDGATSHQDDIANWNPRSRWTVGAVGPDHRHGFTGLRARAADVSCTTDQSGAATYAGFLTARSNLDSPHGVAGDLICIVSPEYYLSTMLGFTEVTGLEKYGIASPLVSGELARLGGVPIVVSEFVTSDMAADGMYDHVTKTKTGFLLFNRSRFFVGNYKATTVELDKNIRNGVIDLVATKRAVFYHLDSSSKKNCHWSFNL